MHQTRTDVHSPAAQRRGRARGDAAAYGWLSALQLGAQLLLWVAFFAYDRALQATWQAAALLIAPLLALYFLWRAGEPALQTRAGRMVCLALLPCLVLDAAFLLFALSGLIGELIPHYPAWVGVLVPAVACALTALCARGRGAAYGAYTLRWLLVLLFVVGTLFLRASSRSDRLWPLLGRGVAQTALTALPGAGGLWGVALLFARPPAQGGKRLRYALGPWAAACVFALWFGLLRPWGRGDVLSLSQKLLGLSRSASGMVIYELAGLLWMLLLPLSLTGTCCAGEALVLGAFAKCPRWIPAPLIPLPGALLLLCLSGSAADVLNAALPYRAAVSLLCGAALCLIARKEKRP